MTVVATAKKLGVNAYQYILDRISKKMEMPPLASLLLQCEAVYNSSERIYI